MGLQGALAALARSSLLPSLFPVVAAFAIFVSYPRAIYKCQAFACTCSTLYDLCIPIVRERPSTVQAIVEACRLGPSSQQLRKNSTASIFDSKRRFTRCTVLRERGEIKSRDEISLFLEKFILFERTLRLNLYSNINRRSCTACCSQI